MSIEEIRRTLDRIEDERINPFIRLRADELREILDALDECEHEKFTISQKAKKS